MSLFAIKILPAIAIAAMSASAFAASKPAPVSALVKPISIPFEQFKLENGLRVIVHTDRKAPVVAVSVWYGVGSKHEPRGRSGFAHLFEHLMFNGSENANGDFFEPLKQVGATGANGSTWFDRTNYYQTVPTGALDLVLFLESDRMGHLLGAVTQEKLDNQREVVKNEKRQGDNQPFGLAFYEVLKGLFPEGHPYRHHTIGSMADLDAASLADVHGWFKDKYGPNNAVLVLSGDIDLATARKKVDHWFGAIPRGPEVKRPAAPLPVRATPQTLTLQDRIATTRITRYWAIPGLDHKDAVALQVGASVLGGLSSSRLDNALVRKEQIAVAVTSSANIFQEAGFFEMTADVKPGSDPELVGRRMDEVMEELVAKGPSADEVRRVAARFLSGEIAGLEPVIGKATVLAEGALYRSDPAAYRQDLKALVRLRPAKVRAAMKRWVSGPAFTLLVKPGERAPADGAGGVGGAANNAGPAYFSGQGSVSPAADRSRLPAIGALAPLDFPDIERAKLSNGIEVVFVRRAAIPAVRIEVSFDAGYAADAVDRLGTQELMLRLMPEGTQRLSSVDIAEEGERLGASVSADANVDRTSVSLYALKANLRPSIELLADIIRNPAFKPDEVKRLRAAQLNRIAQELSSPAGLAGRFLPERLYGPAHPYGRPASGLGDPKVVKALTPDDLTMFHQQWIRPERAKIFVVGDTALGEIVPLLEGALGGWTPPAVPSGEKKFMPPPPASPKIYLIDRPASPQSHILGGQVLGLTGRDDLVAIQAANEILGGDFLSRINMDLREAKGWSYGANTSLTSSEGQIAFVTAVPVQADRTGDSIRAILGHIREMTSAKGVTPAELERTVNGNVRELPGLFEHSASVMQALERIVYLGRPDDHYEKLAAKYGMLTAGTLDSALRSAVDPARMSFVVVGDARIVRPQLDGIGLPVETVPVPATESQ